MILVTGADGFIGSHLVERLVRDGLPVKALVQYNSLGSWGWLDVCDDAVKSSIEVVSGDIRDAYFVDTIMGKCDTVLHLAALIAIPYSYSAPQSYVETNIGGTLNVLQAALKSGVSRVIHTSTSEVYGSAQYVPIDESHPIVGQSPYSASKIGADQLAYSFFASYGLPVVTVRPFNTYGPRQSARAVIPSIITQLANGVSPINLGALHPTRDFSYVSDTVSGFTAAMVSTKAVGEVINLGSGFEISIRETAELIATLMNCELRVSEDVQRVRPQNSEVSRLFASQKKAKELLNWTPEYSGLKGFRAGITQTIEWFKDHVNLSKYKSGTYNI
jgi:dTDP-glucose 4,6-dehydratase